MTIPGCCPICGVTAFSTDIHRRWHEDTEARLVLLEAHSENLIERVYELEGGDVGVLLEGDPDQPAPYVTKSGRVLTDVDIQALADEAERGYWVAQCRLCTPAVGRVFADPDKREAWAAEHAAEFGHWPTRYDPDASAIEARSTREAGHGV